MRCGKGHSCERDVDCLSAKTLLGFCDVSVSLKQAGTLNPVVGQADAGSERKFCFCLPELLTVLFI